MRKIINTGIWAILFALLLMSCDPQENDDYGLGKIPTEANLDFSITPKADQPNVVTLTNNSKLPGVAVWDLGNGAKTKGQTVTGEYPFKGSYDVSLTLYTEGGSATLVKKLEIVDDDLSLLENPLYTALTGGADEPEGKTWVFKQYYSGHFGLGAVDSLYANWWKAGPNEKLGASLYTQKFTFKQIGVEMLWENNGYIYTNQAGVDDLAAKGYPNAIATPVDDYDVEYEPNDSYTFSLITSDSILILSDGAFLGHYAGTSEYRIMSISDEEMYLRAESTIEPGNAWYYLLVPEELNVKPEIPLKEKELFEDFEDDDMDVIFSREDMGALTDSSYQNPAPSGGNTSQRVFLYEKAKGKFYSNVYFVADGYKFDLTEQNQITLKVFIPSYNDYTTANNVAGDWIANNLLLPSIAVKLQNSEKGDNAWETQTEILKTGLQKDQWLDLTFDFSNVADSEDYDKIVVQFGMEGHDGGGIFFFDDFGFHK